MAGAPLPRDQAERVLAELSDARDRAATTMYALDSHPAQSFLRGGTARGTTLARWEQLQQRLELAWAHFTVAGDLLEAAREVRARRTRPSDDDLVELTALLHEPIVGFDAADLPADGTGAPPVRRLGLADLLTRLAADSSRLLTEFTEVQTSVTALTSALVPLTDTLYELRALAGPDSSGPTGDAVAPLADALTQLRSTALTDPLRDAPGGVLDASVQASFDTLAAELATARSQLAGMAALRTEYPQHRARLAALLTDVADAERDAAESYATVEVKIADPGLPAAPTAAAGLLRRLDELDQLYSGAAWATLAAGFGAAERDAHQARQRAGALAEAATGLLERRDELRGRLDAYRAKAARIGIIEDAALTSRYHVAHQLLYTAPCDLPGATRAVFAYQQAMADLTNPRKGSR